MPGVNKVGQWQMIWGIPMGHLPEVLLKEGGDRSISHYPFKLSNVWVNSSG
jgi:hypothetical protein